MKSKSKTFSTDRQVAHLKLAPGESRAEYFHESIPGLYLRVGKKKKSWIVTYHVGPRGKQKRRRVTIGEYPQISLATAVTLAKKVQSDAKIDFRDIILEKQEGKESPTVKNVIDFYLKEKKFGENSEYHRILYKDAVPALGHKKAADLTRSDIKNLHKDITERGAPVVANRVIRYLKTTFNYAEDEEYIPHNPYPRIKNLLNEEAPRERILMDAEIRELWQAMELLPSNMRDIHRLLLLLGQRSTETMKMRKEDIDVERREWFIGGKDTKNSRPMLVPLPPMAWSIIEPRLQKHDEWLFPSRYNRTRKGALNEGRTKDLKEARYKLQELTGITGWTSHDLRRTCRTLMTQEGVPKDIAEITINHTVTKLERTYDRYEYIKEKRQALEIIERTISKIVELEPMSEPMSLKAD